MLKKMKIIGLMSGTSLDGLDVAYCEFASDAGKWNYKILAANTYSYSAEWKERLQTLPQQNAFTYVKTHVEYGHLLGNFVKKFIKEYNLNADYIASHGHTIFHQPHINLTSQIGDGAALATVSGLPVICDFRSMDVALGGQGAPLVPIGDKLLFSDYQYCLNIGGITNISFDENGTRKAFDISPANMVLNYFAEREGIPFDKDGLLASSGKIQSDLFNELNLLPFYADYTSKSLGREWFESIFLPVILAYNYSNIDILSTVTEHIAYQIGRAIKENSKEKMLITGGGAKNFFLIERIAFYLPHIQIVIPDNLLIDYKEALIFAFLGYLRVNNQINCLKTVTGASTDHIAGAVYQRK
jgi:anhydro-N-acetylmuramic acid kinase